MEWAYEPQNSNDFLSIRTFKKMPCVIIWQRQCKFYLLLCSDFWTIKKLITDFSTKNYQREAWWWQWDLWEMWFEDSEGKVTEKVGKTTFSSRSIIYFFFSWPPKFSSHWRKGNLKGLSYLRKEMIKRAIFQKRRSCDFFDASWIALFVVCRDTHYIDAN